MNTDVTRMRWYRQLVSAVALNALDLDLWAVAFPMKDGALTALDVPAVAAAAARHVHHVLPYRFTGTDDGSERILELRAAVQRGWGACGDATAAVASCILMVGGECTLCYEAITKRTPLVLQDGSTAWDFGRDCVKRELSGYAHVRVVVDGVAFDAFPSESLEVQGCTERVRLTREVVSWPVSDVAALHRLDVRCRQDGPRP